MAKNLSNKNKLFITFEGPDGCGKSTIAKKVYDYLSKLYKNKVVLTREPGGKENAIAEDIRNILLNHKEYNIQHNAEALLFAASRAQHVNDFIIPHLKKGHIVLCDRYIHSSLVYQGYVSNLGINKILEINKFAIKNTMPNLVILIMLEPKKCIERIRQNTRNMNRLDYQSFDIQKKVYSGYQLLIKKFPNVIKPVNGDQTVDNVFKDVLKIINKYVKK